MKISFMTPAVTVFNKNGELDVQGNKNVYDYLIQNGVDGIVLMGTTGEFFSMPIAQKKELVSFACEHIKGRTRLIVGTGSMNHRETIELSNYAQQCGADAVMIIPPFYVALTDESLERYFSEVAKEINTDIYLYNFPDRTGYDIKPEIALKLAKNNKNIIGYKDTVTQMEHTRELIRVMHSELPDFEILSGFEDNFAHNVLSGGNGCIGAISNLAPDITTAWCKAAKEKDFTGLVKYQRVVDSLMALYSVGQPVMACIKKAMMLRGVELQAEPSFPLSGVDAVQEEKIKKILKAAGIKVD